MKRLQVDPVSNRLRNCDNFAVGVAFDVGFIVIGDDGGGSLKGREHYRRSGADPSSPMTLANEECRTRSPPPSGMNFVRDSIEFCD
ncbi:hypothetical protein KPH14_010625 [Odynerus spinipes]|uniref:Uncharacterized protein n=1 Tax=Odynerus spinipes TaxID=1348599 RepID=A0AAD9RW47_9HYME|nr:hypothetical protein KPH14_010625 [Odynerus spinipes]